MGVRVMVGHEQGSDGETMAILYDSVTGVPLQMEAFGEGDGGRSPEERAEAFLDYVADRHPDPRFDLRMYKAGWLEKAREEFTELEREQAGNG